MRRGEPGLKLGGPQACEEPRLSEGTPWESGMSWGGCGAILGLKWPLWGGLEGKALDTSRIRKAPPVLGLGVLGSGRGGRHLADAGP